MSNVGFLGLGHMGLPLAANLANAGHAVRGYDLSEAARAELERSPGTHAATDLADAVADADVAILVLPSSAVVEQVLDDVLAAMRPGAVLVDMGSSSPYSTREAAARAAAAGIRFVDAPVSGGTSGSPSRSALEGTLTIIAGGADADVADCMPLFESVGSKIRHVGPVGAGHALKAINNLLSGITLLASSEALELGRQFGLDPQQMLDVINSSSGRSDSTERKLPRFVVNGAFDSGGALALMVKDMRNATSLAERLGVRLALGMFATGLWAQAMDELDPGADYTEIARWVAGEGGA